MSQNLVNHIVKSCLSIAGVIGIFLLVMWYQSQPASAHNGGRYLPHDLPACTARILVCDPSSSAFASVKFPANGYPSGRLAFDNSSPKMSTSTSPTGIEQTSFSPQQEPPLQQDELACLDGRGVPQSCNTIAPFQYMPQRLTYEKSTDIDDELVKASNLSALAETPCVDGFADIYPCSHIDLLSFLPLNSLGGSLGSDIWGWTDSASEKEYVLMGLRDGTAFVDISDPVNPVYLGSLPAQNGRSSAWRDIKVYNNHAFIVADGSPGHGMQVFDLTQLRFDLGTTSTFSATAVYTLSASAHNIAINQETGFAYITGSSDGPTRCSGGLHMVDISTPINPTFAGCFSSDGYTHDTQCILYSGPDADYQGQEVCFNSNEDTLTIVDVGQKNSPVQISRKSYEGASYSHQGWLTEDQLYFVQNDESDERNRGYNTTTLIWNVRNLDDPQLIGRHIFPFSSVDHNLYIRNKYIFEANYTTGLRILDASDISNASLYEVAYFDTYPSHNSSTFVSAWSSYPFFESGVVAVSTITEGLFVLRPHLQRATELIKASFFADANYGGAEWAVQVGIYDLPAVLLSPVGNDEISSIEIEPGYEVRACSEGDGNGTCTTYFTSTTELGIMDNQISYVEIVKSEAPNTPPVMINPGPQINTVGDNVTLQLTASDEDGGVLAYSASGLPDGLTVYSTTGQISGTVTTVQTTTITATVEDSQGGRDSVVFSWTVTELPNRPPVLTSPGPQTNRVGDSIALQLTATDEDGDELTYSAMDLPDGLTVYSTTGRISGTVTTVQTASITATVEDSRGGRDSVVFSWTVTELPNTPPVLNSPGPQTNRVGDRVSLQLTATDDDGDELTYSAMGLPDGLTISSPTGQISGMVTTVQTASITATVEDIRGGTDSIVFTWTVNELPNTPPALANPGPQTNRVGDSVTLQLTATDDDGDELTYSAMGLPDGLTISSPTGQISGMVTTVQTASITATVEDIRGGTDSIVFSWTVNELLNTPPALANPGPQTNRVGDSVTLQLTAIDEDSDALAYSAMGLPDGLTVYSATGQISGMVTTVQTMTTTATVEDMRGGTDSIVFTWTVNELPNTPPALANPGPQTNRVGDSVTLQLTAIDEDGDALAYSAMGLPDGLTVYSATGQISGMVTTVQTMTTTATVEDMRGGTDSIVFTWTVNELPNTPPALTNPGPQTNGVGDSVTLQLAATDDDGDVLAYNAMGLPDGLTVYTTTGEISGTVTTVQTTSITATVEDMRGGTDRIVFNWTVTELPNVPPVLNSPGPQTNRVGDNVTLQLIAADDDGDALTYSAMGLPDGLTIYSTTGQISGTVTTAQAITTTATVKDSRDGTNNVAFSWTVMEDASNLLLGDANCDQLINSADAEAILQYDVGLRTDHGDCPLRSLVTDVYAAAGNVNGDLHTNVIDALFILQCEVDIINPFCPGYSHESISHNPMEEPSGAADTSGRDATRTTAELISPKLAETVDITVDISAMSEGQRVTIWVNGGEQPVAAGTARLTYDNHISLLLNCVPLKSGFCHEVAVGEVMVNFVSATGLTGREAIGEFTLLPVDGGESEQPEIAVNIPTLAGKNGVDLAFEVMPPHEEEVNQDPGGYQLFLPLLTE